MAAKILLVNPPVYDFTAYDFWMRPYGLLTVGGYLRERAGLQLFDYLDRRYEDIGAGREVESDRWGRGRFYSEAVATPECLKGIPRYFKRFGLPREVFAEFVRRAGSFDFVLVQTVMSYWYPGVREVIDDVRRLSPGAKIVLGGPYVGLCPEHAESLGADLLITGADLEPLWGFLEMEPRSDAAALWEAYGKLDVGVIKISDGCPFACSYCSVANTYGEFGPRPVEHALEEMELLCKMGARNMAFYDDSLLFDAENVLGVFLEQVLRRGFAVNFHTPNGLNARFITGEIAELMVRAGFRTFYLGFESASQQWQEQTGSKVYCDELAHAVEHLRTAGAAPASITAYQILGHPDSDTQELEESMRFVRSLGIRGMLADFSPIPGTPDGERCGKWVDMAEPLMHNKTAFPVVLLGFDETNRLKDLQRILNRTLP